MQKSLVEKLLGLDVIYYADAEVDDNGNVWQNGKVVDYLESADERRYAPEREEVEEMAEVVDNPFEKDILINGSLFKVELKDYNGHLNIYLESLDGVEDFINYKFYERTKVVAEDEERRLVWGKDYDGFVHYGSIQKNDRMGHKAGYIWSSRASVFNGLGCELSMECCLNHIGTAMTIDMVKQIIDGFKKHLDVKLVRTTYTYTDGSINEVSYDIILPHHWEDENGERMWDFKGVTYTEGGSRTSEIIYG